MTYRLLVVNYGGPSPGRETEYLKNLFSDPVVFPLPSPVRRVFANLMALWRRGESARILEELGGKSPLLEQTLEQARALGRLLGPEWKVSAAMLYSRPLLSEVLREVKDQRVVVLPLFPQYSAATWGSVRRVLSESPAEGTAGLARPFYDCELFLLGWEEALGETLKGLKEPFLLFSAHSLPLYLIRRYSDPYPRQVEETARRLAKRLDLPFAVGYQSKLGPVKWLEPSTENLIKELAKRGVKELVVVPISFTAENSETLWEVDLNYRKLAREAGIDEFRRVPVPHLSPRWLECWRALALEAAK
ncbi:MAG: ferrochelatase [Aquificae bacterium]|nr:ferrochelatase [Aquificota bacterium]